MQLRLNRPKLTPVQNIARVALLLLAIAWKAILIFTIVWGVNQITQPVSSSTTEESTPAP